MLCLMSVTIKPIKNIGPMQTVNQAQPQDLKITQKEEGSNDTSKHDLQGPYLKTKY